MTHLAIAGGAYLLLLALIIIFQPRRSHALKPIFRAITSVVAFFVCLERGGKEAVVIDVTMTPEMTPQGDSMPPETIQVVSEEDAAKAVEGLED